MPVAPAFLGLVLLSFLGTTFPFLRILFVLFLNLIHIKLFLWSQARIINVVGTPFIHMGSQDGLHPDPVSVTFFLCWIASCAVAFRRFIVFIFRISHRLPSIRLDLQDLQLCY
ncbi:hypothetical protein AWB93_03350 [Mycobacterium bohemicum]|uniref:Uncharacterized protein n=1 Tax=Mycobacterium bohemicum TaxID=56425 RepID=A0A1X1RC92_MYCBE|nr:hypothetical protein AWB93_03350 [Mycobacterium bohemicum]